MEIFSWDDSLSINIKEIDDQHKVLVNMINDYYNEIQSIAEHHSKRTLNELRIDLVGKMKKYSIEHFKTEDKLFEKYDYPNREEHNKEHDLFIGKVESLERRLSERKLILTTEITDFLKDWFINHISSEDQKYGDFLRSKGVD